ncbi:MAG TPA: type IV pilus modification protein PilV [Rhodanobacteraceae bacterium]|nr:type IV pilus modification protein PilV [Rhodanobacteraceae bacterium]
MTAFNSTRRGQRGVGMLEVLIAVLVTSIGFLGMAALQAKALSTNNSAMARSMATVASYSILDAMRADLADAEANAYDGPVVANNCAASGGSGLAHTQLVDWCQQLGDRLGALATTTGTVSCTKVSTATTNTADCTVTIQFDDSRAGSGGSSTQKVVTRAKL